MLQVPGYSITSKVNEGSSTIIFRAIATETGQSAILKIPKGEYPTPRELATLRQEYLLLRSIDLIGVVKTFGLERYGNGLALILEDLRGQTLAAVERGQQLSIEQKLQISIQIVEILKSIHRVGIIHRDLKPQNIIVDQTSSGLSVHLIDFGSAAQSSQSSKNAIAVPLPEASLAYTSPEQTGRMNRSIDYRTDFYSLGVLLYELFAGALPFTSLDPIELVHSHIARVPTPPHQLVPAIPEPLSLLIMKLLAKAPEDRYQSAYGIRADLERCLTQWQTHRTIESFPLARHDHSTQLRLSQKLYGRQTEVSALLEAYQRTQKGSGELLCLLGSMVRWVCHCVRQRSRSARMP